MRRRWDIDERGVGVADAAALVPELDRLRAAMLTEGWVAEQPEHHLLPHVRRLCAEQGWEVRRAEVDDAVLAVDVAVPDADRRALMTTAYALFGTFAEPAAFVRQEEDERGVTLVAATGVLDGDSTFAAHGHTVRIRVAAV